MTILYILLAFIAGCLFSAWICHGAWLDERRSHKIKELDQYLEIRNAKENNPNQEV